jgi:hypothetical protein
VPKFYKPQSITEALKPYHYPEDQDGKPKPTPSPAADVESAYRHHGYEDTSVRSPASSST